MTGRRLAQVTLMAVVVVTLAIVLRPKPEIAADSAPAIQDQATANTTWVAYYFHGDVRCDTCRAIEAQAEAAVRAGFADELADGVLTWKAVNFDRPENAHFLDDYQLTNSTVVLAELDGARTRRFVSLDQVWVLIHEDDDSFQNYLQGAIADWVRPES